MDTQERCRRARRLLIQAALWAPSVNERDIILEPLAKLPDLDDTATGQWPGPLDADSANDAAIRDDSGSRGEVAAAVVVVRVPPNNQPSTSLQHVVSAYHDINSTTIISHLFTASFLSELAGPTTSPMGGHRQSASTSGLTKVLTDLPRGSGPKFTGKKSGSGPSSQMRNRQWEHRADQAGRSRGDAHSSPEGLGAATKRHQVGCHSHTLHRRPNRGPSLRMDLLVGLAPTAVTSTATQTSDPGI